MYEDIVEEYRADLARRGWRILWRTPKNRAGQFLDNEAGWCRGVADWNHKVIECIHVVDRFALVIFLHECGHVLLGHGRDSEDDVAQLEYEAEKFAIDAMRANGIRVPRSSLQRAAAYVDECIRRHPDVQQTEECLKFAYGRKWREHV